MKIPSKATRSQDSCVAPMLLLLQSPGHFDGLDLSVCCSKLIENSSSQCVHNTRDSAGLAQGCRHLILLLALSKQICIYVKTVYKQAVSYFLVSNALMWITSRNSLCFRT